MIKSLRLRLVAMVISVASYAQSQFEWKEAKVAWLQLQICNQRPYSKQDFTL